MSKEIMRVIVRDDVPRSFKEPEDDPWVGREGEYWVIHPDNLKKLAEIATDRMIIVYKYWKTI